MDAIPYNGSDASQKIITPAQFYPDFIWTKSRNNATNHILMDTVRGGNVFLSSNATTAETTSSGLATFSSNGVTWTGGAAGVNASTYTYVNWAWNAGSNTTSSNTSGSITSTVSVNTTAGFSVVTYTGTGANATVGHGLGVAPKMIIIKNRTDANGWIVGNTNIGWGNYLALNDTSGSGANSTLFQSTAPTSSVFTLGTNVTVNNNTKNYVAYCWAEIAGFSSFGSYTGNGSTDGPFVYLGFRPKYVMIKNSSALGSWWNTDSSRSSYNVTSNKLAADSSGAESTGNTDFDFTSNGFKVRNSGTELNGSGNTIIYMAFAENPFKNSNAR
jgi:hypothetical protein